MPQGIVVPYDVPDQSERFMNELRSLDMYDVILVFFGGGAPTRCVISHRRGIPPTGEVWDWIAHFEDLPLEEGRRLARAGRTFFLEQADGTPWAILIVNGAPVLVVRGTTDASAILGHLK